MTLEVTPAVLADQPARDAIETDVGTTMLVEAAAGTGKTSSMIRRMVALLAGGHCPIECLAAVTFTRKATAEMRGRFQIALEKAAAAATGQRRDRLGLAVEHLERCFIGTIHSFCARLLRERPIEAGVDVAFEELHEDEEFRLRRDAWDEHVAQLHARSDPVLVELEALSVSLPDLEHAYIDFAVYPDVRDWPMEVVTMDAAALDASRTALGEYAAHMERVAPSLPHDPGSDTLMPLFAHIPRQLRHARPDHPGDLIDILERIENANVTQKCWPDKRGPDENRRHQAFVETHAGPLVRLRRQQRYDPCLRVLRGAVEMYDRLRANRGALNFEDLLLGAATLLRDNPQIRRYFAKRFTHLLVDEFQDTDPVQAEVMMLLTAGDTNETNWRECKPRPGSLFVVGDPKQSIYRFRRADIMTYSEVRRIIESCGRVVQLKCNFRSIEPIIDWINEVSKATLFPDTADDLSPADAPMVPGSAGTTEADLAGVWRLDVPSDCTNKSEVVEHEADIIARTIQHAVGHLKVPRTDEQLKSGVPAVATYGDFLILTWFRDQLIVFANKLQALGIPVEVSGGTAVNDVEEVALLHTALAAVVHPDDPVALVGALRSELFGISDTALYRFKCSGGRFNYRYAHDEADVAPELAEALGRLQRYDGWLNRMPAPAAIERITGDLGLMPRAIAGPGGADRAGAVCKAIELLRGAAREKWTAADLVSYLGHLVLGTEFHERHDGLPVSPHAEPAVRVMNLHQAKGLEAAIVYLADGAGKWNAPVHVHIDRAGGRVRGYFAVHGRQRGFRRPQLAIGPRWDEMEAREKQFLDAERKRLVYVAITRAAGQLVISNPTSRKVFSNRRPWGDIVEHVCQENKLADPAPADLPTPSIEVLPESAPDDFARHVQDRWAAMKTPTFQVAGVKEVSVKGRLAGPAGEHGTEWGTVIHTLLEAAMTQPDRDLTPLAVAAVEEQQLEADFAGEAVAVVQSVTCSDLWQRALSAPQRMTEVPIQRLVKIDGPDTILRGVIDLVFRETETWVIVDYKTDDRPGVPIDDLVEHYAPQVRAYAEAWADLVGPVGEIGLFFVHSGTYRKVDG